MRPRWQRLPRWGQWTIGILAVLFLIALVSPSQDEGGDQAKTTTVTVTTPAPSVEEGSATTTQTQTVPAQTIADARHAADGDDYPAALAIAATLTAGEATSIRRRIANRLGTRALAAVRTGNRGLARRYIIEAQKFPSTLLTRQARSSYKAAKARAALRRQQQRAAAQQRRQQAAERERQQAIEPAPAPSGGGGCDPGYSGCVPPYPPDVNCPDIAGPVQVTGSDPHGLDRDGDGVACE